MINETLRFNPLKEVSAPSYDSTSNGKDLSQLMAKLHQGDCIEGTLIEAEQGIVLKLSNGLSLPVNLLEAVDLGKILTFMVIGKEDQKLILQPQVIGSPSNEQLIDNIMNELKLPKQSEMKTIIGQFIEKQLPLNKESLLSVFQSHKSYDLPTEMLVNLKSSETPLLLKDVQQIAYLKSEGMKTLINDFTSVIGEVKSNNQLEKLVHDLANTLAPEQLQKVIKSSLIDNYIAKQIESDSMKASGLVDNLIKHTDSLEVILKEWSQSLFTPMGQLEEQINDLFEGKSGNFYEKLLKTFAESLFKNYLEVDLEQIKDNVKEREKITDTSDRLREVIEHLSKMELPEEGKEKLQQMTQTLQVIQKYNVEAQYFCFPMILNEKESTGELYFFKPKKKQGDASERMYIVMALQMPSLHKVEVHIEQIKEAVNMTLKVETQSMKEQIEFSLEKLSAELKKAGYALNQLQVKLLKDSQPRTEIYTGLYHMDLKA